MKKYFFLIIWLCLSLTITGQVDTTVYQIVEEIPRFPACEHLDTTLAVKQECATQTMLSFIHRNIVYPQQAINEGIEGMAVVSFIVEKDGRLNRPEIIKDLGGGTGAAALKIIQDMKAADIKWVPGKNKGEVVRTKFILPVRFKIKDPDPYVLSGRDSIYVEFDKALEFKGGVVALETFLLKELDYPDIGLDSCQLGQIDIQVLIESTGNVRILNLTDYNDLGFDFWYAAIDAATSTYGQWVPAEYDGRKVNSSFELSLSFTPNNDGCVSEVERYDNMVKIADEGSKLINEDKIEEGLAKLSEAIEAFPNDAQLRMFRGQVYLDNNQLEAACTDLSLAKKIALIRSFDTILPLICK